MTTLTVCTFCLGDNKLKPSLLYSPTLMITSSSSSLSSSSSSSTTTIPVTSSTKTTPLSSLPLASSNYFTSSSSSSSNSSFESLMSTSSSSCPSYLSTSQIAITLEKKQIKKFKTSPKKAITTLVVKDLNNNNNECLNDMDGFSQATNGGMCSENLQNFKK